MKIVIVHHHVLPGQHEVARRRIDTVTRRMQPQDGLVFRHVGVRDGMPDCLSSVTGWRNAADLDAWDAHRATLPPIEGGNPYTKVEEYSVSVPDLQDRGA
jgi:hypothetical protein